MTRKRKQDCGEDPSLFGGGEPPPGPDPGTNLASYDAIVVNSSAGKDSQSMLDYVACLAYEQGVLDRLVVLHCDLGRSPKGHEIEWPGTRDLAREHAEHYGLRFVVVQRGVRGFLEEVDYRGMWPANQQRYCTSKFKQDQGSKAITALAGEVRNAGFLEKVEQLGHWPKSDTRSCTSFFKRDQGARAVTAIADEVRGKGFLEEIEDRGKWPSTDKRYCTSYYKRDASTPTITALADSARTSEKRVPRILQCFGFRAQESTRRRKLKPFTVDKRISNTRKTVHVWLPIHTWKVEQVWERIREAGTRHHPAYDLGMSRLSCRFCIFAPKSQLMISARANPELFEEYVELEKRIGHRFTLSLSLVEVKQAVEAGEQPVQDDGAWNM